MSMLLPGGCRIGKMSVHPQDWDSPQTDLSIDWYVHYRFHDPRFKVRYPKGHLVTIRGMNGAKNWRERHRITLALIKNEEENLRKGFNPHKDTDEGLEISPGSGFATALWKAHALLVDSATKVKIAKALLHIHHAIAQLRYNEIPVSEVEQHHLEVVLMKVAKNKEAEYAWLRRLPWNGEKKIPQKWGPEAFNSYRAYLQMLFKQLKKNGANKNKPVDDIEKKKGIKPLREEITKDEFDRICDHLQRHYYTFFRLIQVFSTSGARETEFMRIQKEHVDLAGQRFRVLVKKGSGAWEWKWKTITLRALPYWEEVMAEAKENHFLFSEDLRPGATRISARQLTIRWRRHVKTKLGITKDFYEMKHTFSTRIVSIALQKINDAQKVAAKVNGHTTTAMEQKYDLQAEERLHRELVNSTAGLQ